MSHLVRMANQSGRMGPEIVRMDRQSYATGGRRRSVSILLEKSCSPSAIALSRRDLFPGLLVRD